VREFTGGQKRVLSAFFGNIAVGWFVAGVISTFLAEPESLNEFYVRMAWGMLMAYLFLRAALYMERK